MARKKVRDNKLLHIYRARLCWVTIATSFLLSPAVSLPKHDVSAALPQPFSSMQKKKKMPTFLSTGTLSGTVWKVWCVVASELLEHHLRCRCRCLFIKRSVSSVTKEHEDGESTKNNKKGNNGKTGVT